MLKNKYTKGNICASFALSLFLILSMPIDSKATTGEENIQSSNPLYINILNFTMPLVKSLVSSTDENAQLNYSLKEMLLEKAGLDINSPLSVVAREFSLIKVVDNTVAVQESNNSIIINPFKLNENNIIKISQNDSKDSSENNLNPGATAVSEIYNPNLKTPLDSSKPEVFIYHTHTTESFKPSSQDNLDPTKSVVAVGDIIQNELQNNYGIATIHDKTIHNVAVYNEAYARSGETVNKYLSKYKDFKLIIDLHRDASIVSNPKPVSVTLNNKSLAKIEFVVGTANKNYQQNLSMTRKLINISQGLFPGLVRMGSPNDNGVYYIHAYFNQNKSANATLLEVGNEINTLDEAKTTGYYIARIIAEYINGKH
ncbi:stage II sporulation protein P [Candidatus Clostridium radicumherbarum]|uniref:Stage II sporulation protein P n=1 Tax=Candidatus Clostridium radicumherbarum TaxID=3381662 RepID=A0ABW8TVA4_9CLOT